MTFRLLPRLLRVLFFLAILFSLLAVWPASVAAAPESSGNAGAPVAAPRPAQFHLVYRFAVGQAVYYDVSDSMTITTSKGPVSESAKNETRTRKHYRVVEVADDGSATLELTLDEVQMTARFGEGDPATVDSTRPDDCPAIYRPILKSIGRPLARIRVDSSGNLLDSQPLLPLELQRQVSSTALDGPTPDDDPKKNVLVVFPDRPLSVGESWSNRFTVPVNVSLRPVRTPAADGVPGLIGSASRPLTRDVTILRKFKLLSVTDGLARVSLQTGIVTPVRDPGVRVQLIQREPSGTIEFDIERGVITSREIVVDKTVLAPFGDDSLMHAESRRVETLVDGSTDRKTAAR